MQKIQVDHAGAEDSRLRLVFSNTVLTFNLAADASLGEIARIMSEFADEQRHGDPVAIDVTLPVARA
jgi:hypothetical protein